MAKRTFDGGTVTAELDGRGRATGSRIKTEIGTFRMPHYPSRIKDVKPERGELIAVETRDGEKTFFGRQDALEEGGAWFSEVRTGTSMGGHSPKAHGKIRYIVRAFGKWAGGKQHICVKRLLAEHPEVVGGSPGRANALCAWIKDQWTASTHWRGPGSNPKVKARDAALEAKANATAYARFSAAMPEMTNVGLDTLVEVFNDVYPVEDMLSELGIETDDDPYVALFEHDATSIEVARLDSIDRLRAGKDLAEAMKVWLAVHSDVKPIVEAQLAPAVERVLKGEGPLDARNELDGRVLEAQRLGRATEPWDLKPARTFVQEGDVEQQQESGARPEVSIELPPRRDRRLPTIVVEGETLPSGELREPRPDLVRMDFDDLADRARGLYESTAEPTPEGRRYLLSCGRNELARLVERLEGAFGRAEKRRKEDEDALAEAGGHFDSDPQYRTAKPTPGVDSPTREKVGGPTQLDQTTIEYPPNLRRGYVGKNGRPRACATCLNFADGRCRAYGNYAVSAGEFCDSYEGEGQLNEADGYMTRGGQDVGRYVRIGKGEDMALHIKPDANGDYDERTVRMGMSRLANPDNPCEEVHVGHVRIRHRDGEHMIEPDWGSHVEGTGPEVKGYATVRHGARHATELANSRVRHRAEVGDAITQVDAGTPNTPDNPQWPMMPQMGEAGDDDRLVDAITSQITEAWESWGHWYTGHPKPGGSPGRGSRGTGGTVAGSSAGHKGHIPALLRVGTHGHYMHRVKNQMFKRITGHFPHATTGPRYNKHFRAAVRHFQKAHGLKVDGIVGRQTIAAIKGNKHASKITPGRLTAADRRWLREGDVEPDAGTSVDEITDLVVEQLALSE